MWDNYRSRSDESRPRSPRRDGAPAQRWPRNDRSRSPAPGQLPPSQLPSSNAYYNEPGLDYRTDRNYGGHNLPNFDYRSRQDPSGSGYGSHRNPSSSRGGERDYRAREDFRLGDDFRSRLDDYPRSDGRPPRFNKYSRDGYPPRDDFPPQDDYRSRVDDRQRDDGRIRYDDDPRDYPRDDEYSRDDDRRRDDYHPTDDYRTRDGPRPMGRRPGPTDSLPYDDEADWQEYPGSEQEGRGRRRSRSRSYRSSSRSDRAHSPYQYSKAHHTLIMEGLPESITEADIVDAFNFVQRSQTYVQECIREFRLRHNRMGRTICFVDFYRIDDAEDFVERNHRVMTFNLPDPVDGSMQALRINVNYSKQREGARTTREDGWACSSCPANNFPHRLTCYKCGRNRDDPENIPSSRDLTGESDEAKPQVPSQYLVVRDLSDSATEEMLAEGLAQLFVDQTKQAPKPESTEGPPPAKKLKSTAPVKKPENLGARPDSLRRVFLMRDSYNKESWKYGFAEYWSLEDAQNAMAKFLALPKFTICAKPAIVAFIHTGVFVPVFDPENPQYIDPPATFVPVYNPNVTVRYWDPRTFPSIMEVQSEPPSYMLPPDSEVSEKAKAKKPAKKAAISPSKKGAVAGQDPSSSKKFKKLKEKEKGKEKEKDKEVIMASQMQAWAEKRKELRPGDEPETGGSKEGNSAGPGAQSLRRASHWRDTLTSYAAADSKTCLLCMEQFETAQTLRDHEVLNPTHKTNLERKRLKRLAAKRLTREGSKPKTLVRRKPLRASAKKAPVLVSYAEPDGLQCLLCERNFRRVETLRLHERESKLHRSNRKDKEAVTRAVAQLKKLGKTPVKLRPTPADAAASAEEQAAAQYRDRARERRTTFKMLPTKTTATAKAAAIAAKKKESGGVSFGFGGATAAAKKQQAPPPPPSKGAALLSKMGWTAGQGLGADGSGPAEALKTDLYVPGVGLGAEGGKVGDAAEHASRKTVGYYADFVKQTKDKARERFERLSEK